LKKGIITEQLKDNLEVVLDSSFDGIVITDTVERIIYCNKTASEIIGINEFENSELKLNDILSHDTEEFSLQSKILETKKPAATVVNFATGEVGWIIGSPKFDDAGNTEQIIFNIRRYRCLEELEQEKGKFYGSSKKEYEDIHLTNPNKTGEQRMVYRSTSIANIVEMAKNVAAVDSPVLIYGESGVGKEIIANILHYNNSGRCKSSIVKVNCGAIPGELLESELFGYEEGAFTGAQKKGKPGVFELANNGTLFLDEIADMPMHLQVKLLRALNDQQITRLGGTKPIKTDARIVTATNKDLSEMVARGEFRADLYYRLSVIPIRVPPLRERREDIIPLATYFLDYYNQKYGFNKTIAQDTMDLIVNYNWPGNVRELKNLVERLVVTVAGDVIQTHELPDDCRLGKNLSYINEYKDLNRALDEFEAEYLRQAFEKYGSSYKVGKALGISQTTAYRKGKRYRII